MRLWIVCAGGWALLLVAALVQRAAARPGTIAWGDAVQRLFWMWAVPVVAAAPPRPTAVPMRHPVPPPAPPPAATPAAMLNLRVQNNGVALRITNRSTETYPGCCSGSSCISTSTPTRRR